jgi:thiol:disulfide interchange protein DsbC
LKILTHALFVITVVLVFTVPGHAFKENGQSCAKCHSLSEKEMAVILEKLNLPSAKVLSIAMGPVKGLWEVVVESSGRRSVIYVDFAKKLVTPGPFLDFDGRKNITRERTEALNKDRKVDIRGLPLEDALVVGKAHAPLKVVVFTDPACPYCAKLHREMKALTAKRPDIVFYVKLFAIISGDPTAAKSIVCARSLAMLEDAYDKKPVGNRQCGTKEVDDNMKFAEEHGIDGAPALVFPDGSLQVGYSDAASLEKKIDETKTRKQAPGSR